MATGRGWGVQRVAFNELPAAVRARFVEVTKSWVDPRLVHANREVSLGWFAVFMGFVIGGAGFVAATSTPGVGGPAFLFFLAAALGLFLVLGVVRGVVAPASPYKPGTYVFPSHVVQARANGELLVHPLAGDSIGYHLTEVRKKRKGEAGDGVYDHTTLSVGGVQVDQFGSPHGAQKAQEKIEAARTKYREALARGDQEAVRSLDPFHECTASGSWTAAAPEPVGPRVTGTNQAAWVAQGCGALFLAFLAGLGMFAFKSWLKWKKNAPLREAAEARRLEHERTAAGLDEALGKLPDLAADAEAEKVLAAMLRGAARGGPSIAVFFDSYAWPDPADKYKDVNDSILHKNAAIAGLQEGLARLPSPDGKPFTASQTWQKRSPGGAAFVVVDRRLKQAKGAERPTITFQATLTTHEPDAKLTATFELPPGEPDEGEESLDQRVREMQHRQFGRRLAARLVKR